MSVSSLEHDPTFRSSSVNPSLSQSQTLAMQLLRLRKTSSALEHQRLELTISLDRIKSAMADLMRKKDECTTNLHLAEQWAYFQCNSLEQVLSSTSHTDTSSQNRWPTREALNQVLSEESFTWDESIPFGESWLHIEEIETTEPAVESREVEQLATLWDEESLRQTLTRQAQEHESIEKDIANMESEKFALERSQWQLQREIVHLDAKKEALLSLTRAYAQAMEQLQRAAATSSSPLPPLELLPLPPTQRKEESKTIIKILWDGFRSWLKRSSS